MNLHPIHQTPAELAAHEQTTKMDEMVRAVKELNPNSTIDLSPLLQALDSNKQKLEEIKSAILANTIVLKRLESKEQPEPDFTETNRLLSDLLAELKKPVCVKLNLK